MSHILSANNITLREFDDVLSRYEKHIPAGLHELDQMRFDFPVLIAERRRERSARKETEDLLMEKDELIQLVDWKLKHGTFRPKLQQLVKSNDEEEVHKIMRSLSVGDTSAKEKMKLLTELKGIGPATASLVLSCIDPHRYPFFSDELFRWIHWDGENAEGTTAGIKSGKGWRRPIGYTQKEYDSLIARCEVVQQRLSDDNRKLNFLDLEKVAYVLGKEKVELPLETTDDRKNSAKRSPEEAQVDTDVTRRKRRR